MKVKELLYPKKPVVRPSRQRTPTAAEIEAIRLKAALPRAKDPE